MNDREEIYQHYDDRSGDPMLCRALWLSVIAQAMVDAKNRSRKATVRRARTRAMAWFNQTGGHSDFELVCDLAGVRPDDVRSVLKQVQEGEKTIDFRCLRKPKFIDRLFIRDQLNTINKQSSGENHGNH